MLLCTTHYGLYNNEIVELPPQACSWWQGVSFPDTLKTISSSFINIPKILVTLLYFQFSKEELWVVVMRGLHT